MCIYYSLQLERVKRFVTKEIQRLENLISIYVISLQVKCFFSKFFYREKHFPVISKTRLNF